MAGRPKTRAKREALLRHENVRPEMSADVIINYAIGGSLTQKDFENADKAIDGMGLSRGAQDKIKKRLREVYAPHLLESIKDIDRTAFIRTIESKRWMILNAITPEKIMESNGRDLAVMYGLLQDKQALLMGEPTAIVSFERQEKMGALTQMLLKEAQNRGITLEQQEDGSYAVGERA